jgi:CRP-like cAMP-binding protein
MLKLVRNLIQKIKQQHDDHESMMMSSVSSSSTYDDHLADHPTLQMKQVWDMTKIKIQKATSVWLNTFVIKTNTNNKVSMDDTSSNGESSWHFRTLFVAEITVMPFLIAFLLISFWLLNRNTHIKKTKGTTIVRRKEDIDGDTDSINHDDSTATNHDYDDDHDYESSAAAGVNTTATPPPHGSGSLRESLSAKRKRKTSARKQRHTIQEMLKSIDVERDEEDETYISVPTELDLIEESDDDEDDDLEDDEVAAAKIAAGQQQKMFLSKEKRNLFKIVKEIPLLSYLNDEAMEICMEYVENIDFDADDNDQNVVWEEGKFDGSLFYIVAGRVKVKFHDFTAKPNQQEQQLEQPLEEKVIVTHEAGTVVTSLLGLLEGMIRYHLINANNNNAPNNKTNALGRFVGWQLRKTSATVEGSAKLIRVPPECLSKILDRFPNTILRIIQIALNRTQRVTVQTLVRACGLRDELLTPLSKDLLACSTHTKSASWKTIQDLLDKNSKSSDFDLDAISETDKAKLMKNACIVLASSLDVYEKTTIDILEENSSLVALDSRGGVLFEAGKPHDACYLLLQGTLEMGVHVPVAGALPQQLQKDPNAWQFQRKEVMRPGSMIGETACFTTDVNLFEVRCAPSDSSTNGNRVKPVILLQVSKDIFGHLVVKHPQAMAISLVSIFNVISPVVHLLTWTTEWLHIEAAEEIAQKGTVCDSLFVVLNGRLRAQQVSKARQRAIGTMWSNVIPPEEFGRGKIIGEVSALAGSKWPYDVFAIRQSEVAKVPIGTIETVVQNFPTSGLFLARAVASHVESLYRTKRRVTPSYSSTNIACQGQEKSSVNGFGLSGPSFSQSSIPNALPSYGLSIATIAVVPLTYNVDLKHFCAALTTGMNTIAPSKLLTKSLVRDELGEKVWQNRNGLHSLKMTRLLADMEENSRVVIYQADPKYTFWTRLCIRQADCILLIVDANRAPETSRVEQTLAWAYEAMDVRIDLVVVGEGEAKPADEDESFLDDASDYDDEEISVSDQLNNWSESRKWIAGHHLVRAPFKRYPLDFLRMCRRISGRAVGLVLGGGGARGIAHVGVIRALQEAGVTVDMVGGKLETCFHIVYCPFRLLTACYLFHQELHKVRSVVPYTLDIRMIMSRFSKHVERWPLICHP